MNRRSFLGIGNDFETRCSAGGVLGAAGLLVLAVLSSVQTAEAQKPPVLREIRHLGGPNAVAPRPLVTEEDLQRLFRQKRAAFVALLRQARWEGDAEDLLKAIEEGKTTERSFPVGGRLQWMAFGRPRIGLIRDVVWAAEEPFEAFEVRFESNDWRWVFIVPKACGNLALFSRAGTAELAVSLSSGELRLKDPEGRDIVVRAGESTTVSAARTAAGEPRGQVGVETAVAVEEGRLEFRDYGAPIAVTLEGGEKVKAAVTPEGQLAFSVPATNTEPLPIRIGDATGTLSAGSEMKASFEPSAALRPGSFGADWIPAAVTRRRGSSRAGVRVIYAPEVSGGEVVVRWRATLEPEHAAFNLYRARGDGQAVRVNPLPIVAESPGDEGVAYTYEDRPPGPGVYRYWLESVDVKGHAQRLPETVEVEVSR